SLSQNKDKVTVINDTIENIDIKNIPKPDIVSSMISLSLIDLDPIMSILDTLDDNAIFVALLITSEATNSLRRDIGNIESGPVTIRFENNDVIFIDIRDTIVEDQIEYPKSMLRIQ